MSNVEIKLKVVATLGDKEFEGFIDQENGLLINGQRIINSFDIKAALKRYILRNCGDEEILEATAVDEYDRSQIAYNLNISSQLADALADELCQPDDGGTYPYEFCVLLQNPRLSGKKLDSFANHFLELYEYLLEVKDKKPDYETIYLLKYIAQNPNVWESTLETLKRCNIPMVVEAAKR